jgi:hypothetical protein
VQIVAYAAVDDVGRAINPLILHGQTHGGIAQGVGQGLLENSYYEPDTGQLLSASFMDYALPRADTLPNLATALSGFPAPTNRLGVRSGGEGGTTPALAAVINTIVDALAELGVHHVEMPATTRAGVACHFRLDAQPPWFNANSRGSARREAFSMNEHALRKLISAVKAGRTSRRSFMRTMVGLGLTAPFASQLLAHAGLAQSPMSGEYKPSRAGGCGALITLFWQAPTSLNPQFAVGAKDVEGAGIFYEPLASWDPDGNLVPMLAAEIPNIENGGVAADGMSVTWKLKTGVEWHDGQPFTADDVVFNRGYASDPARAATTIGIYQDVEVEKVDTYTVLVRFKTPTPFWAGRANTLIIPKHLFAPYKGANSREAPANLKPVGTGPYQFVDFAPGAFVKASAIRPTMCPIGRISTWSS